MKDGFIKAAALTPQIRVADPAIQCGAGDSSGSRSGSGRRPADGVSGALPGRLYGGRSPLSGDASLCGAKRVEARRGRNFLRRCDPVRRPSGFGQTA